jgi:hypothetical protein
MENSLNLLSRRAGFNAALRHFKSVNAFAAEVAEGYNLADLLNDALQAEEIERFQVRTIIPALLVDKFAYHYQGINMLSTLDTADKVLEELSTWGNIHVVISYHHPQAGLFVVNPANPAHWEEALPLLKDELVVMYCGAARGELPDDVLASAVQDVNKLLHGKSVKAKAQYKGTGKAKVLKPEKPAAPEPVSQDELPPSAGPAAEAPVAPTPGRKSRMTPRYGVLVTNELFHNGNVEAWKRIIESYRSKYAGLDVLIWYENERINDINTLFKWGKVKHGTPIMISVAGDEIKDVSKLQRYLFEGASPRFEVFLQGGVGRVLDLF